MNIKTPCLIRYACIAAGLLATTDAAHAGVITSGATVLKNESFVINSATSSLAYNPGTFTFGTDGSLGPSPTVNYNISGSFDATIWTIDDGGTDWLTINKVSISANGLPNGFQMPDFVNSIISGLSFLGDSSACSGAFPAGSSCVSNGPSSTITGQLQNGTINFSAFVPVGEAFFGGGSTYQINAAVAAVPVPAAFWLFASAIGFYGIKVRPRKS